MKAPYTIFGKTKQIPVVTYTDGKIDTPPKTIWHKEMWKRFPIECEAVGLTGV